MKKLIFFADTLRRLSPSQIFFLVFNKIVKKQLNPIILKFNKRVLNTSDSTDLFELKKRIVKVFGKEFIWNQGVSKKNTDRNYYEELKINISQYSYDKNLSEFIKLWNEKTIDVEVNYNYQRFYLFEEAFEELKIKDQLKINLMIAWIKNVTNYNFAWSGFNCAMRLLNWIKILNNIDGNNIHKADWTSVQNSIYQQHLFNTDNIERHIPGNHVLVQYYSAWLISILFVKWFSKKEETNNLNQLVAEIDKEFLDSGLHFELSTHYHLQITLTALYLVFHLKKLGREIPGALKTKVDRALNVLETFMIGKYYPVIGDGCYNFYHKDKEDDLKNLFSLAGKYKIDFNNKVDLMNYSEKYLLVKDYNFDLIFDVGEIGLRQNAGHGHADTLSVILGFNKQPLFIDPGTKRYSNLPEDLLLKKTEVHNTVSLNSADQGILWGFFRWAFLPKIKQRSGEKTSSKYQLIGSFDGFRQLGGVSHKRTVELSDKSIFIEDTLIGNNLESIKINFILHPQCKVEKRDDQINLSTNFNEFILQNVGESKLSVEIEDQLIYDNYDSGVLSKKINFTARTIERSFNSKLLLKVIS